MNKIFEPIDNFFNSMTMYRLLLYGLIVLVLQSFLFSALGFIHFSLMSLVVSCISILAGCGFSQFILGKIFKTPVNSESAFITAFILFLLIDPVSQPMKLAFLFLAGVFAMVSKYLLAIQKKHLFNPAAITVFLFGFLPMINVTWWIASDVLIPLTLVFGLLVVRKVRRFSLLGSFLLSSSICIIGFSLKNGLSLAEILPQMLTSWPIVFFSMIMLTEPRTLPPTLKGQIVYGIGTGILFGSPYHFRSIYASPELALIIMNIYSYLVGCRKNFVLTLQKREELGKNLFHFSFTSNTPLQFRAGQYMEWTLGNVEPDSRGNRRYLTIASSPSEKEVMLAVKIPDKPSSFKKSLLAMKMGETMVAGQIAGNFTLDELDNSKLVFIAGGIGITPFRSMIQELVLTKKQRDIVLFYCCSDHQEFMYQDIFTSAKEFGITPVYVVTRPEGVPAGWQGEVGRLDKKMLVKYAPDFTQRKFYISGTNAMVESYEDLLRGMGVGRKQIIVDFFPGY